MKSDNETIDWYVKNRPVYQKLAVKIENILTEVFDIEQVSYHLISSRAKELESLRRKISGDKYDDPASQIHDFAGIRIITYFDDEIQQISEIIEKLFKIDSTNSSDKSEILGIDKVGYKSVHFVATLKPDRLKLPEYIQFKDLYFEIQIRTILQHAWAEIEHDRNYKFTGKLPHEISRRFKLLAGVLEMADREFNNISREIDVISQGVKEETEKGNLNIELNSTSLSQFLRTRMHELFEAGYRISSKDSSLLFNEMHDFGLQTLDDLNKIIPDDFIEVFKASKSIDNALNEIGLIRMLMIVNNHKRYFEQAFKGAYKIWSSKGKGEELFKHYGIDWDKDIERKYNVSLHS